VKIHNYIIFLKKNHYLTLFLFILIFWFFIFITTGSIFSGYHFTDDHEIVHINYNLKALELSDIEIFIQWINKDILTGRFRPFYYIHRIVQTKFFGLNFGLWSIYTGLLAVFTTFFLFIFGKLIKFSTREALLFSFLTTLGSQSAVWWQLGPAETIGTFLLSAALVLLVLSETAEQHKTLCKISFISCVIMMSLSKESFILVIPAIAFINIWIARKLRSLSWKQAIKKKYISVASLFLIFCVEISFIKFSIGLTPDIGYAGVDKFNITQIIDAAKSLTEAGFWWIILASLLALLLKSKKSFFKSILCILKALYFPVTLLILVILPQILLYAKSGISQRYLLPGILGYSFLLISLYSYLNKNCKLVSNLTLLLIMISLCFKLNLAVEAAQTFALEGKSTNALLQTVQANTKVTDPILLVTNPVIYEEWNFSIKKYVNYVSQRDNLYLAIYGSKESDFFREIETFYNYKTLDRIKNKTDIQCIVTFPEMKRIFLKNSSSWFVRQNFEEYEFGNFNRNLNKNSKIHLFCKQPTA
jgi:hypothetical protein